jgi:zinc protease
MTARARRLAAPALLLALFACRTPPAWELPPPPPPDEPVVQPGHLHRTTLDNGLEVLVLEDPRLPRVVLGLTFRRGEAMLPPEQAGLASFSAELLQRGAGKRNALAFAEAVDRLGASVGAAADWDTMGVSAIGLSRDLDSLLDLVADMVLDPRFDAAEAERARSERLASLERAKDDPNTLVSWYMGRALYDGHRFGLPVSGTPETVARFDAPAAHAFYEGVALPNNAIFSVSGDVDAADVTRRIRERFADWAPGNIPPPGPLPPAVTPTARKIVVVDRPDLEQTQIALAHEGISRTNDERVVAGLMNLVVGGSGFSSRLMATLRSEAGLTYSVYSGFSMRRAPGPYVVATFTRTPELRRALDLVLKELERARSDPPDEDELVWARSLAVGRFSMGLETSAAVADALVDLDVYGLPENSLDTYRARVRAVHAKDVARSARELLHPDRAAIVLVGPASEIVPQVESLGPVEVVTP